MKTVLRSSVLFLTLVIFARAAGAECGPVASKTLVDVCKRYTTAAGQVQCFKAGKDAKLDQCALGFCDTYHTEDGCTGCLLAIRNKKYSVEELTQCNQFTDESVATSCMDTAGSPLP